MKLAECFALRDLVFQLDERVRYFGILDNRQGMVVSELRREYEGHLEENQLIRDLTFFKGAMANWAIYFGRVQYAVVSHDSFKIIMIPVESGLVIITAEPSLPLEYVERISGTIRSKLALGKL
ncbi:MAG: hypothetical protein ACRECH_03305 [Nitrososphaerales archaeon]